MPINFIFLFPCFWLLADRCTCFPHDKLIKVSEPDVVEHENLLPPDHVRGVHLEKDGDINKDFHHEAFLGSLLNERKLVWQNFDGYKKLIEIFHKIDKDKDHKVNQKELQDWIRLRISEHFDEAKAKSLKLFNEIDQNKDGGITWNEYKARLKKLNPKELENSNSTVYSELNGDLAKVAAQWIRADYNNDSCLDEKEFLAFFHPEQNKRSASLMAEQMFYPLDADGNGKISLEEFTKLPPGEVDPEDAELDREYQRERAEEFKRDMDANHDGDVTLGELTSYLDPRHAQHAQKEANYLIGIADKDGDNLLSETEMLTHYEMFTGSSVANSAGLLHEEF